MPQMSPLNWLNLFITFIILFYMYQIMFFYIFQYNTTKSSFKSKKTNKMNWKW